MPQVKLGELARLIRSKNAGPFYLTFDIMFDAAETYRAVVEAGVISAASIARLYRQRLEDVEIYHCDAAVAIKVSIPRPVGQGDSHDADVFGGQQYAPLMELEVPMPDRGQG